MDKGNQGPSLLHFKQVKKPETEYLDCEVRLAEVNVYFHDEVVILLAHSLHRMAEDVGRYAGALAPRQQVSQLVSKICRSLVVHPLKLHVFFKGLSALSRELPQLTKYQLIISLVEGWKSFHFKAPRFSQGVT